MGLLIYLGIGLLVAIGCLYIISIANIMLDGSDMVEWFILTLLTMMLGAVWPITLVGILIFVVVKYVLIRK